MKNKYFILLNITIFISIYFLCTKSPYTSFSCITHSTESYACKGMDKWFSGLRMPSTKKWNLQIKEATVVRPQSSTLLAPHAMLESPYILVVEDQETQQNSIRQICDSSFSTYPVRMASSFRDGLELLRKHGPPTMLICDYDLGAGSFNGGLLYQFASSNNLLSPHTTTIIFSSEKRQDILNFPKNIPLIPKNLEQLLTEMKKHLTSTSPQKESAEEKKKTKMHTILTIADHPQRTLAPFLERLTTFPTVSYEHGAEIIILIKLLTLRTLCHDLNNSIVFLGYFELLEKQTPLDSLPHALQWKLLRKEGTSLANKTAQIMQSIPERQILIKMLWDRYKDLPEPEKIRLGKLMQEKIGRNEELHEPDLSYLPKNLLLPSIEDCERILHTVETSLIPALQNNCDTAIDLKEFLEGTLPPTPIAENSLSNASHYVETMA